MDRLRVRLCWVVVLVALGSPTLATARTGDRDPSFGPGGAAALPFENPVEHPAGIPGTDLSEMRQLMDSSTIVAGATSFSTACLSTAGCYASPGGFVAARVEPDGSLDQGYADGGVVSQVLPCAAFNSAQVTIDSTGRVDAACLTDPGGEKVWRLNSDGTQDSTFAGDGVAELPGNADSALIATQADGGVIYAADGPTTLPTANDPSIELGRLEPNGQTDGDFPAGGQPGQTNLANSFVTEVRIDSQDRILVGRYVFGGSEETQEIRRFKADGSADPNFGVNGIAEVPQSPFELDGSGEIFVAGAAGVTKLQADGTPDTGFGSDGTAAVPGAGNYPAIKPDGAGGVYLAGMIFDAGWREVRVTHVLANGSLDPFFGADGASATFIADTRRPSAISLDQQGRPLVALSSFYALHSELVRLRTDDDPPDDLDGDGALDLSDACKARYGPPATDGCPNYTRKTSLTRLRNSADGRVQLKAVLSSKRAECVNGAPLELIRMRHGNTSTVTQIILAKNAFSAKHPSHTFKIERRPGTYSVRVASKFDSRFGRCLAAETPKVRIQAKKR